MLKWVVTKQRGPQHGVPRVPPITINGATATTPQQPPQPECSCDKENHCEETIEFETNNNTSYAFNDLGNFYSPRKCRLSSGPLTRTADTVGSTGCSCSLEQPIQSRLRNGHQTPLSSRLRAQLPRKKLRTRRERNKTLAMRLSAANLNKSLVTEHAITVVATPPSSHKQNPTLDDLFNLYRDPPTAKAELLQSFLNSNPGPFREREVKTPEEAGWTKSPLTEECGQRLHRQRAVRRKHPVGASRICKVREEAVNRSSKMETNQDSPSAFYSAYIFRELAREMLV